MFDLLNYFLTFFVLFVPLIYLLLIFYRLRDEILNSKLIVIIYFGLTLILLHKLLFFKQTLSSQDFNSIQIPFFENLTFSLDKYKLIPIWDNSFGGGFDVFSNPLAFYFSSFSFLFLFIKDTYLAANIYIYFQIVLLGIFSFLFLKELGFKKYSSFAGSILLTFNGFVLMRLSPGVGPEYLFTYKWLPLVLLFSYSFFLKGIRGDLIYLAISLAFLFEGNPNIAFACLLLWFIFILVFGNLKKFSFYLDILKLGFLSFLVYSVKLIPGFYLILNSSGRISEIVDGWRTTRVGIIKTLSYYLPIKDTYLPGPFTPGLVGFIFFILGLILVIYISFKNKNLEKKYLFAILATILGLFLTSANFISEFVFSLPVFNRITINPSFYVFLLIPLGIFSSYFWDFISKKFIKYNYVIFCLIVLVSLLSFVEVLKGPSTFGKGTYSFNFLKMEISEVNSYPLYNFLKQSSNGTYAFLDADKFFMLPNASKMYQLRDINKHNYFYGSSFNKDLNEDQKLDLYKTHTNILISTKRVYDKDLELLKEIDMTNYMSDFQNYSILINKEDFKNFILNSNWDKTLKVYSVKESFAKKSLSLNSPHPYSYSNLVNEKNILNGKVITSISYSKNWIIKNSAGENISYSKDENGLLNLENVKEFENVYFTYVNIYIYIGLLMSLIAFGYIFKKFYSTEFKRAGV